jgi:hypothetical protein
LTKEPERVQLAPQLDDLGAREPDEDRVFDLEGLPGRVDTHELSSIRTGEGHPHRYVVTLRDDLVNRRLKIWERSAHPLWQFPESVPALCLSERADPDDDILGERLVDDIDCALAGDFLGDAPGESLVLLEDGILCADNF